MNTVRQFAILSFALIALAFLSYPGSSGFDVTTDSYKLWQNTISDAGMTVNYRGEPITWSRYFFTGGVLVAAVALGGYVRRRLKSKTGKYLGTAVAISFASIAFFPTNTANPPHNQLFFIGVVLLAISFIVMSLAKRSFIYIATAGLLSAYVVFMLSFPNLAISTEIRTIHIISQKVVLSWLFLVLVTSRD